jgi:Methyltransferase domain
MPRLSIIQETVRQAATQPKLLFTSDLLTGFSGKKMLAALQHLAQLFAAEHPDTCYLEVGVFQGLTLLSVAGANPKYPCFGIDNFQAHDPEKKNLNIFLDRKQKLGLDNAHLLNLDYEDALLQLGQHLGGRKVGVYFIDGPHDYRSQLMCLLLVLPHLAPEAVILVDDSNYLQVRQAATDFLITNPAFKLLFESYTPCHPNNMTEEQTRQARDGWWDGVNILVHDQAQVLPALYPATRRNRLLFENDHFVHASRVGAVAPQALDGASLLFQGKWLRAAKNFLKAYRLFKSSPWRGDFDHTNTFPGSISERGNW